MNFLVVGVYLYLMLNLNNQEESSAFFIKTKNNFPRIFYEKYDRTLGRCKTVLEDGEFQSVNRKITSQLLRF